MAQLWWQNIADAISGEKTPQEALDSLAEEQDKVMERIGRAGVQGACGPKLSEEHPIEYWAEKAKAEGHLAPQLKLADENPTPITVDYDTLLQAWKDGLAMPAN